VKMALGHLSLVLSVLIVHHRVRCETGLENGNDLMSFVTVGAWRFCPLKVTACPVLTRLIYP
jgi:hypothetical protein